MNLSGHDVLAPGFVDDVLFLLDEFNLSGSALVLELTEAALVAVTPARGPLSFLRAKGVRVCLDDFGTGHSSITTLHSLPIDQVKLDPSLTRTLVAGDGRSTAVVASVILLAGALGLDLVMEGVETAGEREVLAELGVLGAQGWLLGRPMTVDAAEGWLHDRAVMLERGPARL